MNYDFSEKASGFLADLSRKIASAAEREPEAAAGRREAIRELAATGYLGLEIEALPDLDDPALLMGAREIVSAVSPSLYLTVEYSARVFGLAVARWADREQKDKWLVPLAEGAVLGAVALCEDTVSMEKERLETRSEKAGGGIRLSGRKQYVVNAPVADMIGVVAMHDQAPALFILEKDSPGLALEPAISLPGYTGTAVSGLVLENCPVPEDRVIVPDEKTDLIAQLRLWENHVIIGAGLGLMKAAFETAVDYAKTHRSGGKPVIAYQEIGFKLAEIFTLYQTARLLAFRTAWTAANNAAEAEPLTWCAKVFVTESAETVCGEAMRILGAWGYTRPNAAERAYRCAKYGQVFGTSTELARVRIGDAAMGIRPGR